MNYSGFGALRRLARTRSSVVERCELCSVVIPAEHQHLVDPGTRGLLCACGACAILFNDLGQTKYKRVPRDSYVLDDFDIQDHIWNALAVPTGLVFFSFSSASGFVNAFYPSLAGPTEAVIDQEVWQEIAREYPRLQSLAPDVEALLANRMNGARDYFIVPIDRCYMLTGLVRKHWRGFSGGDEAWDALNEFFDRLRQTSRKLTGANYAGH
jgi:hypothetical protein